MFTSLSLECMPRDLGELGKWSSSLREGERVFVPDIAGHPFEEQAAAVEALSKRGIRVAPHLGARNIASRSELEDRLARLYSAGARETLLLGGEAPSPAGEFDCTLQVLQSEEFASAGMMAVGVAGHPEGHPAVGDDAMFEALMRKAEAIRGMELDGYIVTQLCFDASALAAWLARVRASGIDFPVHVGIAGPISLPRLIKVAGMLGVGKSLGFLKRQGKSMAQLLNPMYDPHTLLEEIQRACSPEAGLLIPHFYAFGNVVGSIRTLRS